jgi:hypothetical protein
MSKISFLSQKLFSSASVSPVSQCQSRQSVPVLSAKRVFCQPFPVLQMEAIKISFWTIKNHCIFVDLCKMISVNDLCKMIAVKWSLQNDRCRMISLNMIWTWIIFKQWMMFKKWIIVEIFKRWIKSKSNMFRKQWKISRSWIAFKKWMFINNSSFCKFITANFVVHFKKSIIVTQRSKRTIKTCNVRHTSLFQRSRVRFARASWWECFRLN